MQVTVDVDRVRCSYCGSVFYVEKGLADDEILRCPFNRKGRCDEQGQVDLDD